MDVMATIILKGSPHWSATNVTDQMGDGVVRLLLQDCNSDVGISGTPDQIHTMISRMASAVSDLALNLGE